MVLEFRTLSEVYDKINSEETSKSIKEHWSEFAYNLKHLGMAMDCGVLYVLEENENGQEIISIDESRRRSKLAKTKTSRLVLDLVKAASSSSKTYFETITMRNCFEELIKRGVLTEEDAESIRNIKLLNVITESNKEIRKENHEKEDD